MIRRFMFFSGLRFWWGEGREWGFGSFLVGG